MGFSRTVGLGVWCNRGFEPLLSTTPLFYGDIMLDIDDKELNDLVLNTHLHHREQDKYWIEGQDTEIDDAIAKSEWVYTRICLLRASNLSEDAKEKLDDAITTNLELKERLHRVKRYAKQFINEHCDAQVEKYRELFSESDGIYRMARTYGIGRDE